MPVDYERRQEKAQEAFGSTIYWNEATMLASVQPEGLGERNCFLEVPTPVVEDNELTTSCQDILPWQFLGFPTLNEESSLFSFCCKRGLSSTSKAKSTSASPGEDPIFAYGRKDTITLSFLTKYEINIPLTYAMETSVLEEDQPKELHCNVDTVKNASPDIIEKTVEYLEKLSSQPILPAGQQRPNGVEDDSPSSKVFRHILRLFTLSESEGINYKTLTDRYETIRSWLFQASLRAQELMLEELKCRCNLLNRQFYSAYNVLALCRRFYVDGRLHTNDHFANFMLKDNPLTPTFCEIGFEALLPSEDEERLKPMHFLILYYLDLANCHGFRKGGDIVYSNVRLASGQPTYHFRQTGDIQSLINIPFENDPQIHPEIFKFIYHSGPTRKQLTDNLIALDNRKFPTIHKNRTLFSFENGTYTTLYDNLFSYPEVNFMPFEQNKVAVAKYHAGVTFHNEMYELILAKTNNDWYALPTPLLFKLWDVQGFKEDVKRFLCMCGGRMFQPLGTDNWQFVLWCIGKAGTGKTTFANIFTYIFSKEDVGTLSQIIEEKFGLANFYDPIPKFIVIAPDLSKGIGLPLPMFLNWISAEPASIPRKGRSAIERDLNIPFIIASNVMALHDLRDALARRVAFAKFNVTVKKSNTKLLQAIVDHELPIIIKKFTLAYWDYFAKYAHYGEDIWSWIPPYFQETRQEMAMESNSIRLWILRSGEVQIITDRDREELSEHDHLMCTPLKVMEEYYNTWKKDLPRGDQRHALPWTLDNYMPIFEELKCPIFLATKPCYWPPNAARKPHNCYQREYFVKNCVVVSLAQEYEEQVRTQQQLLLDPTHIIQQQQQEPLPTSPLQASQGSVYTRKRKKHTQKQSRKGGNYRKDRNEVGVQQEEEEEEEEFQNRGLPFFGS